VYWDDKKIVFRDITEVDPQHPRLWVEQIDEGYYVALMYQENHIFDGYVETNTGKKTKVAIRV
jgi:hypothetical protein